MPPSRSKIDHPHTRQSVSRHGRYAVATTSNREAHAKKTYECVRGESNGPYCVHREHSTIPSFNAMGLGHGPPGAGYADTSFNFSTKAGPPSRKGDLGADTSSLNTSFSSTYSSNIGDWMFDSSSIDDPFNANSSSSIDSFSDCDELTETTAMTNYPRNAALELCGIGGWMEDHRLSGATGDAAIETDDDCDNDLYSRHLPHRTPDKTPHSNKSHNIWASRGNHSWLLRS